MASSSGTGEPSPNPVPACSEQEQKTPAARRNISRSEEDDSDDSGVIRDVARRLTVEAKSPETESKKGMESAEAEVSLGSPKPKEPTEGTSDTKKKEENKEEVKEEKKEEKKPPKKSYLDFIEQKPKPVLRFHVGDLVWGRASGSYYHPAVVTQDPHFKFHTKIVKSEPGSSAVDHETGKVRGAILEEPCRQYHLQQLGDNRRLWVQSHLIIPFTGIADYEQLAIQDVKNINKIYKPKTEAAKVSWREAVLVAQQLEPMPPAERVRKCDWARLREIGGPALQKKLEYDNKKRAEAEAENKEKGRKGPGEGSPEKFKSPSSPRKGGEETERRKSDQVRRREEMDYKMFRMSSMQKKSDDKKRKRQSSEGGGSSEATSPTKPAVPEPQSPVTTFNMSFKKKKEVKIKLDDDDSDSKRSVAGGKTMTEGGNGVAQSNSSNGSELSATGGIINGSGLAGDGGHMGKSVHTDIETETAGEGMGEGTLVWAKMRGYSFWPCVVSRDPEGGEFVKLPDSLAKSQKKIHVLFLEYNNQRAWIPLGCIKTYKGLKDFKEQKQAASKSSKKDYEPGKRYEGQFAQAVDYAEELAQLTDDDRLERVLLKYGWEMVEDGEQDGPKKKKRRTASSKPESTELNRSTATDSEADKDIEMDAASPPTPRAQTTKSSDRRSSAEAESRLDPTPDPPSSNVSRLSTSKKKRTSSLIASIAMNGDSSSSDSDGEGKHSKKPRKRHEAAKTPSKEVPPPKLASPAPVPTAAAMKALAGEEEFPRVGDLVWGRMPGFPFWPCFVTRSPQGQYCKDAGKGRMSYHVQFFNWNDESGWVNSALEFDGLESFKKIAAKRKSDKSYHPAKGSMSSKWEKAAREAEETMGLTRQERAEQYIVTYGNLLPVKATTPKSKSTPKSVTPKQPVARAKPSNPGPRKVTTPAGPIPTSPSTPSVPAVKRKPGPASKTGKPQVALPKRPLVVVEADNDQEEEEPLPQGWRIRNRGSGGQTFISPDGREFLEREAALAYSTTEAALSPSKNLHDLSLPAGWRVQRIQSSIYFFSPLGERRRPGPRSVMVSREELGYENMSEESGEESDPATILKLPNGMRYRKGGQMDPFLDLDKLFDPSNGGMIEMVQLPDIFLDHPTVSVTESDNEMVISDVDTGEFIAKKIIYD